MKIQKTTIVAIYGGVIFTLLLAALLFKLIDGTTFAEATASVGAFMSVLIGVFSTDHKKEIPTE